MGAVFAAAFGSVPLTAAAPPCSSNGRLSGETAHLTGIMLSPFTRMVLTRMVLTWTVLTRLALAEAQRAPATERGHPAEGAPGLLTNQD